MSLQSLGDTAPSDALRREGGPPTAWAGRVTDVRASRTAALQGAVGPEGAGTPDSDRETPPAAVAEGGGPAEPPTERTSPSARPSTTAAPVRVTTTAVRVTTTTVRARATAAPATTAAPVSVARPTTTAPAPTSTTAAPPAHVEEGLASWYHAAEPGTCAHRGSAMGTVLSVTNLDNGKRITCRVSDRGPYVDGRVVDLSSVDFSRLAHVGEGVIRVRVEW